MITESSADSSEVAGWCRRFFATSQEAYALLAHTGHIVWCNDAASAFIGYGVEEVIGTHFGAHIVQAEPRGRSLASALEGSAITVVRQIRTRDRTSAWVQTELLPVAEGLVLVHNTDLRAVDHLALLERAEEIAEIGTWTYRPATSELDWTPGMYRLFALAPEAGPDHSGWHGRLHPDDAQRVQDAIDRRLSGDDSVAQQSFRIVLPGGETRWLQESAVFERDDSGRIERHVVMLQDVTVRMRAEQDAIQGAKTQAVTGIVAGVAHDLNNALHLIVGSLVLARAEQDTPDRWLDTALTSAHRASTTVRQLVHYVGGTPPRPSRFGIRLAIADAVNATRVTPPPTIDTPAGSVDLVADRSQFVQAMESLLLNASEALSSKLGTADFVPSIHVTVTASTNSVAISVRDNGIGMDAESQRRAFDPHYSTKRSGQPVGLGLALVHRFVTDHQGSVDIQSHEGRGTTVTVTLPRQHSESPNSDPAPRGRTRILLADEDRFVVEIARAALEPAGYAVTAVDDGDAVIEACESQPFDLVLVSDELRGRSGWDIATTLLRRHPGLRVAVQTSRMLDEIPATIALVGVIPRPWAIADLLDRVRRFLEASP